MRKASIRSRVSDVIPWWKSGVSSLGGIWAVLFLGGWIGTASEAVVLDLVDPPNYARQVLPDYVGLDTEPDENPLTDLGAVLGRVLFYDPRLSSNGLISCASCHQQAAAFGDARPFSEGVGGLTNRRSMRLINLRFGASDQLFWDRRALSLESLATMPIRNHLEMGFSGEEGQPDFQDLLDRVQSVRDYQLLFLVAFGSPVITEERIQRALAQFVRSIQSFDSLYDQGRSVSRDNSDDFPNFTEAQNRGKRFFNLDLMEGGAGCASCHIPPEFAIDASSFGNGIMGSRDGTLDSTVTRSPTLRDLVDFEGLPHGPFMHDASMPNLGHVLDHYAHIGEGTPNLDSRLRLSALLGAELRAAGGPFSESGKADIVAFLKTLSGKNVYKDSKWSNPFLADGQLRLSISPSVRVGRLSSEGGQGTGGVLTFVYRVAPFLVYNLEVSRDLVTWTSFGSFGAISNTMELTTPLNLEAESMFHRLVLKAESLPF